MFEEEESKWKTEEIKEEQKSEDEDDVDQWTIFIENLDQNVDENDIKKLIKVETISIDLFGTLVKRAVVVLKNQSDALIV